MFTADETTLFYLSLGRKASGDQAQHGLIDRWNAHVQTAHRVNSRPVSKKTSTSTNSTRINSQRQRSVSALTSNIAITSKPTKPSDIKEKEGGLSDAEEFQGPERDEAVFSPVKGSVRVDSKVWNTTHITNN